MAQRVGILAFHYTLNYGAVLQVYALQQAVRSLGFDPLVVDYRPPKSGKQLRRLGIRSGILFSNAIKRWRFMRFRKQYLALGPRRYATPDSVVRFPPDIDVAVCGSDQVWNLDHWHGFERVYFLDFAESTSIRRVSYAPSVGRLQDFGEYRDEVRSLLCRFEHLSARDRHTQQMVQAVCGRDVPQVLDSTFLFDFDPLIKRPTSPKDYIVTYCLARTSEFDQTIHALRERYEMPVVAISPRHAGYTVSANSAGPREWLGYIRHARYVCTNSFHGTVFALKFGKNFIVPPRHQNQTRIDDLLETVGLTDRVVRDPNELAEKDESFWNIDYGPVNERLSAEIEKSRAYLHAALSG